MHRTQRRRRLSSSKAWYCALLMDLLKQGQRRSLRIWVRISKTHWIHWCSHKSNINCILLKKLLLRRSSTTHKCHRSRSCHHHSNTLSRCSNSTRRWHSNSRNISLSLLISMWTFSVNKSIITKEEWQVFVTVMYCWKLISN